MTANLTIVHVALSMATGVAVACVASTDAAGRAHRATPSQSSEHLAPSQPDMATAINVPLSGEPLLRIDNLRVEFAPAHVPAPSALLKFDMLNGSVLRLSDVVMSVLFFEKHASDAEVTPVRIVVGPITVRVKETIEAGYVLHYEMLFRNLSSDCDCAPRVEILSARLLPD